MEKFLKNLYRKLLSFEKNYYLRDAKFWVGVEKLKLNKKILTEFYENYERVPFLEFLIDLKSIIYSENVFDFIVKDTEEDWTLWLYLKFLEKEKIIKVKKDGKVFLLKKEIQEFIPEPQTEKEIKRKIERKLKIKIRAKEPIINVFKNFQFFRVKAKWDQMPISQSSAIFLVKKILEKLPFKGRFLFIGDDDFISVILSIADPKIESLVIDVDEELLSFIDNLSLRFNLKIRTKKVDVRTFLVETQQNLDSSLRSELSKKEFLGEKFIGFLTNPVYTEEGVKEFMKFGKNQLGEDGGIVFLELGEGAIGNRRLFLQDFFTKNNLIIEELIKNKIYYPHIMLHKEDKEIFKRLSLMINKKIIKKSPKLGADLYIFKYLPSRPKRVKFKKPFYAYL